MRIVIKTVLVVLLIAMLAIVGAALTCGQPTLDDLQKRLAQLESQIRTLGPEISKIEETNNTDAEVQNFRSV
jgi:uncharacterized protein YoxC